jgi:periplasmic protein TonB
VNSYTLAFAAFGLACGTLANAQVAPIVSPQDYPTGPSGKHEQGTVYYRLIIGVDGYVKDCRVTRSSGSLNLDRASCRLLTQRARFKPAVDSSGRAIESTYDNKLVWRYSD